MLLKARRASGNAVGDFSLIITMNKGIRSFTIWARVIAFLQSDITIKTPNW